MADFPPPPSPTPRWFWLTLAALLAAMLASLAVAIWLPSPAGSRPRADARLLPHRIPLPAMAATEFPDHPELLMPAPAPRPTPTIPSPAPDSAAQRLWQANSKAGAYAHVTGPRLAILIDDMGLSPSETTAALGLPPAVSFSFFPFGPSSGPLALQAFNEGHEIFLHVPMEPLPHASRMFDPGPDTLKVGDTSETLRTKLTQHLQGLGSIAVGVNNHMGSRFTAWPEGMRAVLLELDSRGYLFLDSLTISPTATQGAAQGLGLPLMKRDVFLDHNNTPEAIARQLDHAADVARRQGFAVAIGHPLSNTLAVLRERLPQLRGVTLVPVTAGLRPMKAY